MKKIEAIVKPSKLKAIQAGLIAADIPCMTVMPVKGAGLQKGYAEIYRGTERPLILLSKVLIMCVVSDENLEKCIDVILDNASEGNVGDGKEHHFAGSRCGIELLAKALKSAAVGPHQIPDLTKVLYGS